MQASVNRTSKIIRELQEDNFTTFLNLLKDIKHDTMLGYTQSIADFIKFLTESGVEDYIDYLNLNLISQKMKSFI